MNFKLFYIVSLLLSYFSLSSMQQDSNTYTYRIADKHDVPLLLEIINNQAIHDRTKIVILPKLFRESALQASIEKKRLFVALSNKAIVGYKKLFIITDPQEKQEILADEIRCINNEPQCAFAGKIKKCEEFERSANVQSDDLSNSVSIYNGGDFTVPAHRGKGINTQLTTYALKTLCDEIKKYSYASPGKSISMLYGITRANAGEYPGASSDRTRGIVHSFNDFLNDLEGGRALRTFAHRRYHAFMPTFDPESHQCIPLPDEQSIPGYGCVLTYQCGAANE